MFSKTILDSFFSLLIFNTSIKNLVPALTHSDIAVTRSEAQAPT
jgi:hypothetical protein